MKRKRPGLAQGGWERAPGPLIMMQIEQHAMDRPGSASTSGRWPLRAVWVAAAVFLAAVGVRGQGGPSSMNRRTWMLCARIFEGACWARWVLGALGALVARARRMRVPSRTATLVCGTVLAGHRESNTSLASHRR